MYLRKGQKCDAETLAEIYGDEAVAATILQSAEDNKTVSRIEDGSLQLPELSDAFEFHQRKDMTEKGIDPATQEQLLRNPRLHAMFDDFERRLQAVEQSGRTE